MSPSFTELYESTRELRACVAALQADGRDFSLSEGLLRRIEKRTRAELSAWQPTSTQ